MCIVYIYIHMTCVYPSGRGHVPSSHHLRPWRGVKHRQRDSSDPPTHEVIHQPHPDCPRTRRYDQTHFLLPQLHILLLFTEVSYLLFTTSSSQYNSMYFLQDGIFIKKMFVQTERLKDDNLLE